MSALTAHATADACGAPHEYLCLTCGAAWCHDCDPAPAACCHYCHGRGYSTAEITTPAMREPCPGCDAEPREPCRPDCLSHVTDSNGQPLKQCHACGSTASRWLDCETCPAGECPERVCIDCGASVGD